MQRTLYFSFFFFNDTATTEIYTLSLHDALPIFRRCGLAGRPLPERQDQRVHQLELVPWSRADAGHNSAGSWRSQESEVRSEEHTSELQSRLHLVCRLLLEKKKKEKIKTVMKERA